MNGYRWNRESIQFLTKFVEQDTKLRTKACRSYISLFKDGISAKIYTKDPCGIENTRISFRNHFSFGEIHRTGRDLLIHEIGEKLVDFIFYFPGMILAQKFTRRVTVAWGKLGLVLSHSNFS